MLKDKTGREIKVGALVDLHLPMIATGLIIDVKHSPLELPGQGLMPACATIQITLTIPAGKDGGIWCYVIKDPPEEQALKDVLDDRKVEQFPGNFRPN